MGISAPIRVGRWASWTRISPPRHWLALLLTVGAATRLGLALGLIHNSFDLESVRIVNATLRSHFDSLYLTRRWPYPGALLPWVLLSGSLSHATGVDISVFWKLPMIAADLALAWLVQAYLALRGAGEWTRLAAGALVCLGPSFIAISGYEGQVDALAILPAVAAVYVCELQGADVACSRRRDRIVALLIGVGGAIKTVPLLLLPVLIPRVRGLSRRVEFCALAVGVPVLTILPWLLTRPASVKLVLSYTGIGVGPLTLAAQPSLAKDIVSAHGGVVFDSLSAALYHHGKLLLYAGVAMVWVLLWLRPQRLERGAAILWLTVYALMPFFFFQYVLWGLPFVLMAGWLRGVAAGQALLVVPLVIWERRPWTEAAVPWVYAGLLTLAWLFAAGAWLVQLYRVVRPSGAPSSAASPAEPSSSSSRAQ